MAGFSAQVGAARLVDRYPNADCIGDSVDGLETRLIILAGS